MNKPVEAKIVKIAVGMVAEYAGCSISSNGAVNFTVKADYSELPNAIKTCQLLNNDIMMKAKVPGAKAMLLGMFRIKSIAIDGDGESKIKFVGLSQSVEVDNLNRLPLNDSDVKQFQVKLEADVELEEDEDDESEDW